ncbi:MAG: hypothetical protein JW991_02965 [Candidatus Pacebacteria bacterium]|nr:hypothetical protein [Candidatus Paceibacterota bacterium]
MVTRAQQNSALLFGEEWTRALQRLKGEPLAGENDKEIDVALFFKKHQIDLTPEFLARHGRAEELKNRDPNARLPDTPGTHS